MYFRNKGLTYKFDKGHLIGRLTSKTELHDYIWESIKISDDSYIEEIIPGAVYEGPGGINLIVVKCVNDKVIVMLGEGPKLYLPVIHITEFDAEFYNVEYQEGLFLLPRRLIKGKIREKNTYKNLLIRIPGFKVNEDFTLIGLPNGGFVDLELFLVSLCIEVKRDIDSIGKYQGITKGTQLVHRISTKPCRTNNHIIDENGFLSIEIILPGETLLLQEIDYFKISYDDSFTISTKKIENPIIDKMVKDEWHEPQKYFLEGQWRNLKIPF